MWEALCLCFFTDKQELLACIQAPSLFMVEQPTTHIFASSVFAVDSFLSLFHFVDDGSNTGAHAVIGHEGNALYLV